MNPPSVSLRTLAAKGLVPLSLVTALVTGNPAVSAQETSSYEDSYSIVQEKRPQDKKSSFGSKLFVPSSFNGHAGMWVDRTLSTTSHGEMNIPQLHEYFLSHDDILYKTTITSGKTTMEEKRTSILPRKVAQSIRDKNPSMPADIVFQHFSLEG